MRETGDEQESSSWKDVPGFAKLIMLLETVTIFFLTFWIYEEYQNNPYLKTYLNSLPQASSFTLIATGSIGFFTIIVVSLIVRLHRTNRELHEILTVEAAGLGRNLPKGFMDRHTEEHLIDMIRKKNQAENLGATESMPLLKRAEQDK